MNVFDFLSGESETLNKTSTKTDELLKGCDVEFPVEPGFISQPPRLSPEAMFDRCEEMLPYQIGKAGFYEHWRANKINVEFIL